jgi:hypothetical protein
MAATKTLQKMRMFFPTAMEEVVYSTLVAGATIKHTLLNQINLMPFRVTFEVINPSDDRSPVFMVHNESAVDLTAGANTIALIFDTIPGGDLTGCKVKVFIEHLGQASGGISA